MGYLVTSDQVAEIIDVPLKPDGVSTYDLTPFIATADLIVTENLATATLQGGAALSVNRLTQIELWLAAHYTCLWVEKGGVNLSQLGSGSKEQYQDYGGRALKDGIMPFNSTRYGQAAMGLDTTNTLATMNSMNQKAAFRTIGGRRDANGNLYGYDSLGNRIWYPEYSQWF